MGSVLDGYWAKYASTLARVRAEKPGTLAELKAILDDFEPPSSGAAFFPGGADDGLGDALGDAGWAVLYIEADYVWNAKNPSRSETIRYVEGDVDLGAFAPVEQ
jgi:hypothetical protein